MEDSYIRSKVAKIVFVWNIGMLGYNGQFYCVISLIVFKCGVIHIKPIYIIMFTAEKKLFE